MTQIKDLSITKIVAEDSDFLVMQSPLTGETYKITKANLLATISPPIITTMLLLHGDGTALIDSSTFNRSPSISTGVSLSSLQSKFGGSSLLFNNGKLSYSSNDFNVGSGDCTIEFFFYTNNITAGQNIVDLRPNINGNYPVIYLLNNKLSFVFNNITVDGNIAPLLNAQNYAALKKIGTSTELWLNGSNIGSATTGDWGLSDGIIIGTGAFGAPYYGYIDEFRFSKMSHDVSILPTQPFSQ
jgi:hypothetical protein